MKKEGAPTSHVIRLLPKTKWAVRRLTREGRDNTRLAARAYRLVSFGAGQLDAIGSGQRISSRLVQQRARTRARRLSEINAMQIPLAADEIGGIYRHEL
jgi:hypothetical protein